MNTAIVIVVLGLVWLLLLFLTFRPPAPGIFKLVFFELLLLVSVVLGYFFLVLVYHWNPNPLRVDLAHRLTDDKIVYLGDIVPGLYDLDEISRVDTDWQQEAISEEWVAFYQYDVQTNQESGTHKGPYGGAIYDYNNCRPPAVLSYEMVPVSYDYLGQDGVNIDVDNTIAYKDPLSGNQDLPEVLVTGSTRGMVTDLNVFRRVGVPMDCLAMQQWKFDHPGQAFPNTLKYEVIGTFRGNYQVQFDGSTVTVIDRSPFERSQITIRKVYQPSNGSYFEPGSQRLLKPVKSFLSFGPAWPSDVPQVYYPEKAVLAFYLNLGKDQKKLKEAETYLSPTAQQIYDIETDPFGLSTDPSSVAKARQKLASVLVLEIRYQPNVEREQLHEDQDVQVTVVGVNQKGEIDWDHPCDVTWTVVGVTNPQALPYGCEWGLESYWTTCPTSSK